MIGEEALLPDYPGENSLVLCGDFPLGNSDGFIYAGIGPPLYP